MANCKILRHAGGNVLRHGTGVILRHDDTCSDAATGSSGGLAGRARRLLRQVKPPEPFEEIEEFEKMISVKPIAVRTNDISLKGLPLLKQYTRKVTDILFKPLAKTDETYGVSVKPRKYNGVHFGMRVRFTTTTEMSKMFKVSAVLNDYSNHSIKGKTLNGIGIIKKAMKMDSARTFSFAESNTIWKRADVQDDLQQRIKILDDKITTSGTPQKLYVVAPSLAVIVLSSGKYVTLPTKDEE